MEDLAGTVPAFHGIDYDGVGEQGMPLSSAAG
jgi:hypothetical protein